jgi:anti-anti-sigma factor
LNAIKKKEIMENEELEITEEKSPGAARFVLKGRVNASNVDNLLGRLEAALNKECKNIVVNMSQVEYLSSIGIKVILKIYKDAKETGGKFSVESPSEIVKNVLNMVALDELVV